ncbi:Uncharacterised protein [Citrobacter werkmanii]|jgi:hypothetical protein|uniref:Uncharacterized protein n=1 Tax=Citrobacter werkmanii TaxID=67827 RepID=A0A9N8CLX3_9ENTR|nr:Uncharacterised protein [Citrobacter werkmanii]CAB5551548.1 Uncharacterised protein [Citrobacter werkmanii]CAB5584025.1 Uncharacterised protein [Citrobacter werkmanii]CAB5607264.1 Uncharacterised protein [Citrobacter werkmanii]CAB5608980.1 Uncharacterised protein [Citrobacter werkmanii]
MSQKGNKKARPARRAFLIGINHAINEINYMTGHIAEQVITCRRRFNK